MPGAPPEPQPPVQERQRHVMLWYTIAAIAALLLAQSIFAGPRKETVALSEFKALVRAGKVDSIVLDQQTIIGQLSTVGLDSLLPASRVSALVGTGKGPHVVVTARIDDPQFVPLLDSLRVTYTGTVQDSRLAILFSWVLPIALLFGIWTLLARRLNPQRGAMAIGKSHAKVYVERSTGVTFADVAGIDEARAELVEIVDFLKTPERYRRLGGKIPKGVLLVGAPGTGKTLLAKALAGEAHVPFLSLSGSDFIEMFVGVGAARVRDLFVQAQAHAPSIIFIDELDALGRTRSATSMVGSNEEREQTLNQLLAEMDGFDSQKGVMILAATNRPEILDPALLRAGRFDRKIVLDHPDRRGREQILRVHTRNVPLAPDADLGTIAARTPGFVGADLASVVNEAALRAARVGRNAVELVDFDDAIERVVAGLERKSRVMSATEKRRVAHHEAGHAIVAELRAHADHVAKISIIPRGIAALGYTRQEPTDEHYLATRSELLDRLDVLLGGRVAEEVVLDDVSTGAQDDLQHATDLARDMVTRFGMSEDLGLAMFDRPRGAFMQELAVASVREYSEATAQAIDREIRRLLDEAYVRVTATLNDRRALLISLANLLVEREVVDRQALVELMAGRTPPAVPAGAAA